MKHELSVDAKKGKILTWTNPQDKQIYSVKTQKQLDNIGQSWGSKKNFEILVKSITVGDNGKVTIDINGQAKLVFNN